MINILVPTDFSDLSKVAIRYAIRFANKIDANITLLHAVVIPQVSRTTIRMKLKTIEREIMQMGEEDMQKLVAELSPQLKTTQNLKTLVVRGTSFNDTIKKVAKKLRSGLIIMGTRGASGLKKYIMGSNTTSVIDITHVPVLVIPELAEFKNFRNVVYATDLKHAEKEMKTLIPYLEKFDSVVHLVHVASSLKQVQSVEKKIDGIVAKIGYKSVVVRILVKEKPEEALEQYVSTIKADMIATFTHEHGFYDKIFNRSITRKMAFQSKIPLLAFKQKT